MTPVFTAAYLALGLGCWLWLATITRQRFTRADFVMFVPTVLLWPVTMAYFVGYLRGLRADSGHEERDT